MKEENIINLYLLLLIEINNAFSLSFFLVNVKPIYIFARLALIEEEKERERYCIYV